MESLFMLVTALLIGAVMRFRRQFEIALLLRAHGATKRALDKLAADTRGDDSDAARRRRAIADRAHDDVMLDYLEVTHEL